MTELAQSSYYGKNRLNNNHFEQKINGNALDKRVNFENDRNNYSNTKKNVLKGFDQNRTYLTINEKNTKKSEITKIIRTIGKSNF